MRTRTLLLLAVVATVGSIGLAGVAEGGRAASDVGRADTPSSGPGREPRVLAVLHRWDRRRSDAWANGDPVALARLYARGSSTGRRDVQNLRRWTDRGLHVTGLRQQVAALRVVRRGGGRLVVVVTDRAVGGVAIGPGVATAVPIGGWTTHRISLVLMSGHWRVAQVGAQPAR
jgi:hypothetical protein